MTGKWPIILYTALLCAQNDGRIAGRVSDSGGLPVVHASVTLRNTLTGASEREETSGTGDYSFSGLSEGRYSLSVSGRVSRAESSRSKLGGGEFRKSSMCGWNRRT